MKLIDRYEFTNGKAFETWYLELEDAKRLNLPECDVIGLLSVSVDNNDSDDTKTRMIVMRPDEALIQSRMLIDAVCKVSEGYQVSAPRNYQQQVAPPETNDVL